MKRVIPLVLTALLSLVTLVGVGAPAAQAAAGPVKVVSLGDSFAAGSTLDPSDQTDALCDRSSLSYPYQLKKFSTSPSADVACGGAVVADLLAPRVIGSTVLAPQIASVSSSAKVVTLTIGGNDVGFAQIAQCLAGAQTPDQAAACVPDPVAFGTALYTMGAHLAYALDAIQAQAPQAQIFVSDYPILLGIGAGGCPVLPLPPAVIAGIDGANGQVNAAIATVVAAKTSTLHVTFVDVAPSFAGHGLCSGTASLIDAQLHPSAAGQQVYADVFNAAIKATFAA